MRFVALGSLLGTAMALLGLVYLDIGWVAAFGLWLLTGPAAAVLAIVSALPDDDRPDAAALPAHRQPA